MSDPYKPFLEIQTAIFEAWSNTCRHTFQFWKHWAEVNDHFYQKALKSDRGRTEIANGPSFTDKYGKRAHDIDPEKDV